MTGAKDGESMKKRSYVEVEPASPLINNPTISTASMTRKRLTRSRSRREQRTAAGAPSTQQSNEGVGTTHNRKDSANEVPPSLNIPRTSKSEILRTPSPAEDEQLSPRTFATIAGHSPTNVPITPLISYCKNNTPKPQAVSPGPLITLSAAYDSSLPAGSPTDVSDFSMDNSRNAIMLGVPYHNAMRLPAYRWNSHLRTTSRPEHPWGWMKKWTCCSCSAITMVEQRDCARLTCGHVRCGDGCRLYRGDAQA